MRVHAAAVVAEEWLGHERRRVPVLVADVLDDVLVDEDLVRHVHERVEAHVDLGLTGGADLVVMHLDRDARIYEREHDLAAQVLQLVDRRRREVALFQLRAEPEVGRSVLAGVPDALVGIDVVVALVGVLVETDRVEDVELELRTPERRVGDARAEQVFLSLSGHIARVATVVGKSDRILDVADHRQGRNLERAVHEGATRIREQEHVALVDLLEAADARAVEADPLLEERLGHLANRDAEVLPASEQVSETEVDHLDAELFRVADDFGGSHLLGRSRRHRGCHLV